MKWVSDGRLVLATHRPSWPMGFAITNRKFQVMARLWTEVCYLMLMETVFDELPSALKTKSTLPRPDSERGMVMLA